MADPDFAGREQQFDSSLGSYVGSIMSSLARADIQRQRDWLSAVQTLATPDKDGNMPTLHLASGLTDKGGKAIAGADISFPLVLALLGSQFAATEADAAFTMNTSSTSLDDSNVNAKETGEGEAHFGIGGFSVGVKISVTASESSEHKRTSDYRATTSCSLKMGRTPTPEPIQRMEQAFMKLVDVECTIATAMIEANGKERAQAAGLLPKPGTTPPSGG